jgi:hypothetical protein
VRLVFAVALRNCALAAGDETDDPERHNNRKNQKC